MLCISNLFTLFYLLLQLLLVLGMSTIKENKGKEVMGEESCPEVQPQTRPSTGDKRKTLPKNFDLGSLPSRRGKKAKHGLSQVVKSSLLSS